MVKFWNQYSHAVHTALSGDHQDGLARGCPQIDLDPSPKDPILAMLVHRSITPCMKMALATFHFSNMKLVYHLTSVSSLGVNGMCNRTSSQSRQSPDQFYHKMLTAGMCGTIRCSSCIRRPNWKQPQMTRVPLQFCSMSYTQHVDSSSNDCANIKPEEEHEGQRRHTLPPPPPK